MAKWNVTLHTGALMPAFGLGTWLSDPPEVCNAVEAALKAGYRHIDCAHTYGNEMFIGETLKKCFNEGVCKREEIFITSKLWITELAKEDVEQACKLSLQNLQLDYVDLYLIHWPQGLKKGTELWKLTDDCKLGYDPNTIARCWEAMEELVAKGLTRAIGISNFSITKTEALLETAKIVPAVNQVECHPYFQQPKLQKYCSSKGIVFEAYSPLGNPGNPFTQSPRILEDAIVKVIAAKHNATPAQVCISFGLHEGRVVIPKTTNTDRVTENLKATDVVLNETDITQLRALDRNHRFVTGDFLFLPGETVAEFWDTDKDNIFHVV